MEFPVKGLQQTLYEPYNLNSLKGVIYGSKKKGDTRSLDYSSYHPASQPKHPYIFLSSQADELCWCCWGEGGGTACQAAKTRDVSSTHRRWKVQGRCEFIAGLPSIALRTRLGY